MRKLDLNYIEQELKKRLAYPYLWNRVQNNTWDQATRFIYKTSDWENFVDLMQQTWQEHNYPKSDFSQYAMNRWYNFWSAQAVEKIFTDLPGVAPNPKPLEDHYDFRWLGEPFDHKTSVFPKGYKENFALPLRSPDGRKPCLPSGRSHAFDFAKANPTTLIQWFYKSQSTGQRFHLKNRMFIVCYDENGEHHKLKAEIGLLKIAIEAYMENRTPAETFVLNLQPEKETLADIIWVAR